MRIRRRYAVLALASAAVLAVAGLAYANHTSNTSSLTGSKFTPATAPKTTFKAGSLFVHTHTNYSHPGNKSMGGFVHQVTLLFDNDFKVTPGSIPKCTATFASGTTLQAAWNACGPGAGAAKNAYLSPATGVSGRASTAPPSVPGGQGNFQGCVLAFRGPGTNSILLFTRVTLISNATADCSNPGSNTGGQTSVTLTGNVAAAGVADFGSKLTVPNIDSLPLALDDFTTTVKRGNYITGRCFDTNHIWNFRGTFAYSGTGQPADTVNATQTCTVG
jgi:hypothetical protein